MSAEPISHVDLTPTLALSEYPQSSGHRGFWLWDKTRGMNLSMRAKTPQDAFVEALMYYQKRLREVEQAHDELKSKVDAFVAHFVDEEGGS